MADWWMVGLTAASVLVAAIALVFGGVSMRRAGSAVAKADEANKIARESNTIAEGQRDAATANNSLAQGANHLATEALLTTRTQHERMQRREDEFHEVRWSPMWSITGDMMQITDPNEVFNLRFSVFNDGPDEAHDVLAMLYRGRTLIHSEELGERILERKDCFDFCPLDREKLEKQQRDSVWRDVAGNPLPQPPLDSPQMRRIVEDQARNLYDDETELIMRWKSAAKVPHQKSFRFKALSQLQFDFRVKFPIPEVQ